MQITKGFFVTAQWRELDVKGWKLSAKQQSKFPKMDPFSMGFLYGGFLGIFRNFVGFLMYF